MSSEKVLGGRYQLVQHLGGGGFGQTFLAQDLHLPGKPTCVVKQLKPKTVNPTSLQTARSLFNKEAEVLYALGDHDRIPRLFAHFEENQEFYLVQEFVEGITLNKLWRRGKPATEESIIELLEDVLTTLKFVHEQQVIHRDIKPSNLIRRNSDGKIVLIDFGAVKQIGAQTIEDFDPTTLTIAIGSPGYTPNEQIAGKPRFSSDIYSLGILAICALLGTGAHNLKEDPRTSEIVWRDQVKISPQLTSVLDKMVRYDFRQRYQSAAEALAALRVLVEPVSLAISTGLAAVVLPAVQSDVHLLWLERGDELFQAERYPEAIKAYDKVIKMQPDEYLAWFKRGIVLESLQLYEEAVSAFDRVIELRDYDYLAWLKRGKALESLQRYQEALESYERVVDLQPSHYWSWCDRGKVLEALGQHEMAVLSYERSIQLKPDFQLAIEGRKRALNRLNQADTLYHLGHYEEVVACCDQILQERPEDSHAWFMQAMTLEKLDQLDPALHAYQQVVRLQPDDHLAWLNQAKILTKLERYEDAAKAHAEVVNLQPSHYWSWYDWGQALEQVQQFETAIAAYDQAVLLKPGFQLAVEARKRVLGLMSRSNPNLDSGENSEAISRSQSIDSQNQEDPQAWFSRGMALEQAHRYPEAIIAYDRAIELKGNEPEYWRRRGHVLYNLERHDEAVASYRQSALLQPTDPSIWYCLGGTLARLKRYGEALQSFDRALQLQPDHAEFWYWRGRVMVELKQYAQGLAAFNRALALNPNYRVAAEAQKRLQASPSLKQG